MPMVTALLVDTISIQNYVYASNKLLENVGASNIVSSVYRQKMLDQLRKTLLQEINPDTWKTAPAKISLEKDNTDFEIGYIGGGNALLFFKEKEKARAFVKNWTLHLLIEAPGLEFAFALDDDFDFKDFQQHLRRLFSRLKENKSSYFALTSLPKHGLTTDCPFSGRTAEVYFKDIDGERYISSVSKAKLDYAQSQNASLLASDILGDKHAFTANTEKLGQISGQNHIAVVHIDGNMISRHFKNCTTLPEIRTLSVGLDNAMHEVYREFVSFVRDEVAALLTQERGFNLQQEKGKTILPFRPLLVEGDDITFLAEGRLGVYLARQYLELISQKSLPNGESISASAGIAIAGTKFPFYRSYILAEELCSEAKKEARKKPGTSWLDFHVAYGGFSGSLEDIRKENYTSNEGLLNFGPYFVPRQKEDRDEEKNIRHLLAGIGHFLGSKGWPKSKIKELRSILTLGKASTEKFLGQMEIKGRKAYCIPGRGYDLSGWENSRTPYFDMIELMDFYPAFLLDEKGVS